MVKALPVTKMPQIIRLNFSKVLKGDKNVHFRIDSTSYMNGN
jgi:hypothetical protein